MVCPDLMQRLDALSNYIRDALMNHQIKCHDLINGAVTTKGSRQGVPCVLPSFSFSTPNSGSISLIAQATS